MFHFSFNRNKSLEKAAIKVLNEAFSFNRSPITQNSAFATQGSVHDRLMGMGQNKRPSGGAEIPGGSVEDTEDAFSGTLGRMGYRQGIDPESGKPTLYGGPSKPSLSLGTGGRMLQQSPISFSSTSSQPTTGQGPTRTLPGYTGQHPVTNRTVEQERLDQQTVDTAADEVFKREGVKTASELAAENERKKQQPGYLQSTRSRLAQERRDKDLERARAMGMTI
jgi:hypothetical protein